MQHRPRLHGGVVDVAGGHVERAQRGQPRGGHQRGAADAEAACQAQAPPAPAGRPAAAPGPHPSAASSDPGPARARAAQPGSGRGREAALTPSRTAPERPHRRPTLLVRGGGTAAMAGVRRPRSRAGGAPGAPGAAGPAAAPPARRRPHCSSRSGAAWLACRPARAPRPPRPRPPARPATHPPGASATSPARAAPGGRQRRRPGPGFRARAAQQGGQASAIETQYRRTLHSPNACRPSTPQQKAGPPRAGPRLPAVAQAERGEAGEAATRGGEGRRHRVVGRACPDLRRTRRLSVQAEAAGGVRTRGSASAAHAALGRTPSTSGTHHCRGWDTQRHPCSMPWCADRQGAAWAALRLPSWAMPTVRSGPRGAHLE